jgi:hypothetical protein
MWRHRGCRGREGLQVSHDEAPWTCCQGLCQKHSVRRPDTSGNLEQLCHHHIWEKLGLWKGTGYDARQAHVHGFNGVITENPLVRSPHRGSVFGIRRPTGLLIFSFAATTSKRWRDTPNGVKNGKPSENLFECIIAWTVWKYCFRMIVSHYVDVYSEQTKAFARSQSFRD